METPGVGGRIGAIVDLIGVGSDHGQVLDRAAVKGQGAVFILQQHDAFLGGFAGQGRGASAEFMTCRALSAPA